LTEVIHIGDKKCYINKNLNLNLDDMKKDVHQDNDSVIIIDGREGVGKSCCAFAIGWYLSEGKLTLNDICTTPKEFKERVENAEKFSVVIFDEAYLGLASTDAMQSYNKLLKKMLVICRQRNLHLILVLPSFFDLNKYCVLHRSDLFIHCFKHRGQRGHFAFYDSRKTQVLYIKGKKFYSYFGVKPNFNGRFTKFYPVNEQDYRDKKERTMKEFLSEAEEGIGVRTKLLHNAIRQIKLDNPSLTAEEVAKKVECSKRTVYKALEGGRVGFEGV
jgi:hypothetical protein